MPEQNQAIVPTRPSYVTRVINNDAAKKGAAAALAGLLVAVVTEALWPSDQQ